MDDAITRALRDSVVAVRCTTPVGPQSGTAFHVAEQLLLTCHHVVAGDGEVELLVAGRWQRAERVELNLALPADLALLRSTHRSSAFVRLGREVALRDAIRTTGFPVRDGAPHEEQILGSIEDVALEHSAEPWKSGARLLKFARAQVWPGFSGAPLYDERTRRVVGVVCATRDQYSDLGGVAVPVAVALDAHAGLRERQRLHDWSTGLWSDPRGAHSDFLDYYLDDTRSPFFGRDAALAALDDWLASATPRALVVADPGRGKSSLLARWYRRACDGKAVHDGKLRIALVPISLRFGLAREHEVLQSLCRCIVEWHSDLAPDAARPPREVLAEGLRRDAAAGVQHLLVLDGLDESMHWHADATLFGHRLGHGVRVLAGARRLAGRDAAQWREQLGWDVASTRCIELGLLTRADSRAAAAGWWSGSALAPARAAGLGERLHELSGGDPLVLGVYLSGFDRRAPPALEALAGLPSGLDGVFQRWWHEQEQQWQAQAAAAMGTIRSDLFNLLAGAFEPVSRQALLALVRRLGPCSGDELDRALQALARFVVGDTAGYALSHPRLAEWRWHRLLRDGDARRYDEAFADWIRQLLDAGDAVVVDSYALRAGARHLQRSGATLDDWYRIAGDAWRAQHQRGSGWPHDYRADLALAADAAQALDQSDLAAKRQCRGLPLRVAVGFGRLCIDRLTRRVPAQLAAQAVRHGLWTSARALQHVIDAYHGDFPRIAALGTIASCLGAPEIERAMDVLALERGGGFDWDETLGSWELAAAAARSGAFDDARLMAWAQSLQGIGALGALLSLAAVSGGDARARCLAAALAAVQAASHAQDRTCLALGIRVGKARIPLDALRASVHAHADFNAWSLAARLGFDWDLSRGESAAAALRVAWPWLDDDERIHCTAALIDRLPQWIEALQSQDAAVLLPQDERWLIVHRDWHPRLGAVWDVCSIEQAGHVYRLLREHFASGLGHGSNQRTCFAVMLRFASRLTPPERRFEQLASDVQRWAFGQGSAYQPEIDELYDAAASLPEWCEAFGEQVHQLRARGDGDAVRVLKVVARHLPRETLDRHWQLLAHFDTDARDWARRVLLEAMAECGESAVRQALQRADEPDLGLEHALLDAVLDGLLGQTDASRRSAARTALAGFRSKDARQAQLLCAIAAPLGPWTLDEVEAWVPRDHDWRSLAIGLLLPHLDVDELCDAETPWRLAIQRAQPDADAAAEAALRIVHEQAGLDAALAWTAALDEACDDGYGSAAREAERDWTALAVCALADVAADQRDVLLRVAIALSPADARAEACAALCADPEIDAQAWAAVEPVLLAAAAMEREGTIARILRRLRGTALTRAIELAEVNTRLLVRARDPSRRDWGWAERAGALLRWADATLIEREFMPDGQLAHVRSSTDRNLLRGGLAPRLLELGCVDAAMDMAARVSEPRAWLAHVAMLEQLHDARSSGRFVEAMLQSTYSDLSLFAVARELQRGVGDSRPEVLHAICAAVLDAATSDARLRLHLAVLLPLIGRLCGGEGVDTIAACARAAPPR